MAPRWRKLSVNQYLWMNLKLPEAEAKPLRIDGM